MRRPDELDVAFSANLGELRVFRQKSVSGMNGLNVADFRNTDQIFHQQVAVRCGCRADAIGFSSKVEVVCTSVCFAEDSDRFDAQFAAGANNSQCNFAAIGN